ncbi:myb-like protein V [Physella acuta]|uniref:myb-like protein V n=1 Tax=Physella acuta TaxID=109671 RepID=UPI0027DBE074|nr:myb-like protein V [Physella acuta]
MPGQISMTTMGDAEVSLFSLELVVEKVYIPHVPCRFPAIAFRLLDFPTIVIKHVEDDLGKAIRNKIAMDPYYKIPEQFIELKDKHGNFMVKKGKSCLFKISAEVLKQHLSQTPLYVMLIDLFPEVPKLIGNSSVPLNTLIESICVDIVKLGSTVPSVHGDKGLFKVYNLMGKEIGYFVLGFRLLCLGPSLIPHIPDSVLFHQKNTALENIENENLKQQIHLTEEKNDNKHALKDHKHSSSMTEPMQRDVLLQTIEMEDKAVLVSLEDNKTNEKKDIHMMQTISTQTDKVKNKEVKQIQKKWLEHFDHQNDDDIIINNIVCPPPMFYNSEASPMIKIMKQTPVSLLHKDDSSVTDLSEIESFDGYGLHIGKPKKINTVDTDLKLGVSNPSPPKLLIPQARPGEHIQGLSVAPTAGSIFPLLTALINELSYIQNPQLLLNLQNQIQASATLKNLKPKEQVVVTKPHDEPKGEKLSPSVVSAVAAALTKKLENSKANVEKDKKELVHVGNNQNIISAEDKSTKSKQSLINKNLKGKLVFGMTNTQRLRLQKTNPQWLKLAEKAAADLKTKKITSSQKPPEIDEVNATTFSDTLTEIRRLAEKELHNTVGGDTLLNVASEVESLEPKKYPSKKRAQKKKLNETSVLGKARTHKVGGKTRSEISFSKSQGEKQIFSPLENKSPQTNVDATDDNDDQISTHSDVLSSRSRSIEVRLPSAEPDIDISSSADESDEEIPLPDDSVQENNKIQVLNFPRYLSQEKSLPDSINGEPNASLNVSGALEENSPLESTRHSKSLTSDQNDSRVLQSTEYDTRQYLSTDEPELQGLMSEDGNVSDAAESGRKSVSIVRTSQKFPVINPQLSENSPVPSIRRSAAKFDPSAYSYIPSIADSKNRISPTSPRPSPPKSNVSSRTKSDQAPKAQNNLAASPKLPITPRSLVASPKYPIPRPRKPIRESIHTDSLSSYMPSDPDNVIVSLSSNSGNYSDDFLQLESGESADPSVEQFPKIISSAKLGYTIT